MAKKSHKPYKFQDIKHSVDGIIAVGLGSISVVLIVGELILTIRSRGMAGGMAGFMGIAAFLLSVVGFVFAVVSWKDEETMDFFKRLGTFLNIGLIVVNLTLLILGIIS